MGFFSRLFVRKPKHHTSAYGPLYSAIVKRLTEDGLLVGGTAGYPRVEIHSIVENQRLDKDGAVRSLALTVESISDKSLAAAVEMNERAMAALTSEEDLEAGDDWRVLDINPDQLQDLPETSDSAKILYRMLQSYDILVERVKTEAETETENNS